MQCTDINKHSHLEGQWATQHKYNRDIIKSQQHNTKTTHQNKIMSRLSLSITVTVTNSYVTNYY